MLSNLAHPFKFLDECHCLHFNYKRVLPNVFSTKQAVKTRKFIKMSINLIVLLTSMPPDRNIYPCSPVQTGSLT